MKENIEKKINEVIDKRRRSNIRNWIGDFIFLGGVTGIFTSLLIGVWWLPQMMEFAKDLDSYWAIRIVAPIGVLFWGIIGFLNLINLVSKFWYNK